MKVFRTGCFHQWIIQLKEFKAAFWAHVAGSAGRVAVTGPDGDDVVVVV